METKNCNLYKLGLCVSGINPQPLDNFFDQKGVKDGKGSRCKACIKAIAHERRLKIGGGQLRVPKRPKSVPLLEKNCSKFKKGECASSMNPQPIINFRSQEGRINGKSICLSCEQKYYEEHREEAVLRTRAWQKDPGNIEHRKIRDRMKNYDLADDQYKALLLKQQSCCAICGNHNSFSALCVDHNHTTKKVRGLLCHKCNRGIGLFNDNPSLFDKAKAYVLKDGV